MGLERFKHPRLSVDARLVDTAFIGPQQNGGAIAPLKRQTR
jgi:hypothetical protein